MRRKKVDKYDIEKLPIREELRDAIKQCKLSELPAIDLIQTYSRMQGMQDDFIQEQIDSVLGKIKDLQVDIKEMIECLEKRVVELEGKVA